MISIGVDYYPEHWSEEKWEKDAEKMRETGVKTVRLAEFAWCRMEPRESEFDFAWLDRAVQIFSDKQIDVILCTPTNCPPLWLYEKYPDALQWTREGKPIATGIRGHRCYNSPSLLKLSERIIKKMAEHYAENPAVTAWQIDNELDAVHCCCPTCTDKFRTFLKQKYNTLENINKTYGNVVWSGEYSSWEQIKPPFGSYPVGWYNPEYMLDWYKFCKQSVNGFVKFQASVLRKIIPDAIITTNTWLCENTPDFYGMFEPLDIVSYDNYPPTKLPEDKNSLYSHAFHLDLMRGIKEKNFWIMEQLSGTPGCWMPMITTPKPGMIKGYSMQAVAHGADKVIHFRWRSAAQGAEMFWHGLLDQSGVPSRRFFEFADLCKTLNSLNIPEDTKITNEIAMLYSPDCESALQIQPQTDGFHYYNQLKSFHDGLTALGKGCDIISEKSDFSDYKVIIAPTLFIADKTVSQRLHEFVFNGGTVILTNRSGVKDEFNNCITAPLPTIFSDMTGCTVSEFDSIGWETARIKMGGKAYETTQWCDILTLTSAVSIAEYSDKFYSGSPCAAQNSFGKGCCFYVGVIGKRDFYRDFLETVLQKADIDYISDLPENVEITVRESNSEKYTFIFNNNEKLTKLELNGKHAKLKPFECIVEKETLK